MGAAIGLGVLAYIVSWLDTLAWPLWAHLSRHFRHRAGSASSSATPSKASGPSFMKDIQFLLIGPLWLLGHLYRQLGIAY